VVIVFGNKNYGEHLGYIVTRCPKCKVDRIFSIHQERQKLTLYFVPTVQYRVKQYMTCVKCGERFEIADELKPQIAERLMTEEQLKKVLGEMTVGIRLPSPYCPECSQPVLPGMKFCPNCGKPLI
jgi:hypothetical protein